MMSARRWRAEQLIAQSELFSPAWYQTIYPDVRRAGIDPLQHYLSHGAAEGRDPGPWFSASVYAWRYPDVVQTGLEPLLHYLLVGRRLGRSGAPQGLPGKRRALPGKRRILVCGHAAGTTLFGGERSLLDVLDGLIAIGFEPVVSVPQLRNPDYLQALTARSMAVEYIPCPWWDERVPPAEAVVERFVGVIERFRVGAVHVNTIMLREPLLAAQRMHIPGVVHVRELPSHDPALCDAIGADSETIVASLAARATHLIANSRFTASRLNSLAQVDVVPGRAPDFSAMLEQRSWCGRIKVGLISSNTARKGVHDFIAVAQQLKRACPGARFLLIGPDNAVTEQLKQRQSCGQLAPNVVFAGYAQTPEAAVAQTHIVLNLSHVPESFGRTVLEAMAAGRPVVAYEQGALPELVRSGVNGFLVPFGDMRRLVESVQALCNDARLRQRMGEAGRKMAAETYGFQAHCKALAAAYRRILPPQRCEPAFAEGQGVEK
ncbi:hypothetical protein CAI21_13935 [Alkalilimnicola ehrlichii]|uniref:Glycosyl transferase family 1 domain-containing protein n=1 Tax=Alkalilimnicola ehrlichii TaxID=351052 RepID=A0A3E0WNY2_9GAMM|nr:glycosyltransferase family 4 protein [Alkalilimnicola ehrlichii]RFA28011.1 hypothetical protein CAI21_13935 [Alkalilimnicola ehrlichii]RFA34662.1 hypothetical protein CAL65_14975 [Alkalilimnicola ehrlichii]